MSVEALIDITEKEYSPLHIASTTVTREGEGYWISTVKKTQGIGSGRFETMVFLEPQFLETEHPLLAVFNNQNIRGKETAIRNHGKAVLAAAKLLPTLERPN